MLPRIIHRLNIGTSKVFKTIASCAKKFISTEGQEGYAFPIDNKLKYELLVDIDAMLFEFNSAWELMKKLFACLSAHAGKPIANKAVGITIRNMLVERKCPIEWFQQLDDHRNFFAHQGAPYIAVAVIDKQAAKFELIIMKENLNSFNDRSRFLTLSDLALIVEGFLKSKAALQEYLIALFETSNENEGKGRRRNVSKKP